MAKKEPLFNFKRNNIDVSNLNNSFYTSMNDISGGAVNREFELQTLSKNIDQIVSDEMNSLSGDHQDINHFLINVLHPSTNNNSKVKAFGNTNQKIQDLFNSESGEAFLSFNERYKNKSLQYEDLDTISSWLIELKEAINITRDSIVTTDAMSQNVSRILHVVNGGNDSEVERCKTFIQNMETKYKLLENIKTKIVPQALRFGEYYVYTVPKKNIFERAQYRKKKGELACESAGAVKENSVSSDEYVTSVFESLSAIYNDKDRNIKDNESLTDCVTESLCSVYNVSENQMTMSDGKKSPIADTITTETDDIVKYLMDNIEICDNECVTIPTVEKSITVATMEAMDNISKKTSVEVEKATKKGAGTVKFSEAVSNNKGGNVTTEDFSFVDDCYIKYIDPRKVIPVKILDYTVGYYYIHTSENRTFSSSRRRNTINNTLSMLRGTSDEKGIAHALAVKITKAFDKKFLQENSEFTDLIMNALMYCDVTNNKLKFQYIPVEYMTQFKINEDEEGDGRSIIHDSLFYGMLYLSILIFKSTSIMTRSNDTRVFYVKESDMDDNITNQVQNIARDFKEKQMVFNDMLNYNSMFNKAGSARDLYVPQSSEGGRAIDFDILSGQDIQLNTEFMEMLKTAYINGTGVPSVIMNYINEADYAKTLEMGNARYLARVVTYQMDFNSQITELYRKILKYSSSLDQELIERVAFTFTLPKNLNVNNLVDMIQLVTQNRDFVIDTLVGTGDTDEDAAAFRDIITKKISVEMTPNLPWSVYSTLLEEAKLELEEKKAVKKAKSSDTGEEY